MIILNKVKSNEWVSLSAFCVSDLTASLFVLMIFEIKMYAP